MSRESTLILLGVLVVISPFVGLPLSILAWILPVLGAFIILIGIALRAARGFSPRPPVVNDPQEPELS